MANARTRAPQKRPSGKTPPEELTGDRLRPIDSGSASFFFVLLLVLVIGFGVVALVGAYYFLRQDRGNKSASSLRNVTLNIPKASRQLENNGTVSAAEPSAAAPANDAAAPETSNTDIESGTEQNINATAMLTLRSTVFEPGQPIPEEYTCDGLDVSPPLQISGVPPKTKHLAIIVDDPDAPRGTWTHWLVWNIPKDTTEIAGSSIPDAAITGVNDSGMAGWSGPCPPSGTHRYIFHLYALDNSLDLPAGSSRQQLEAALAGHILEQTELIGTYSR